MYYYTPKTPIVKVFVPENFNLLSVAMVMKCAILSIILYLHNVMRKIPRAEWTFESLNADFIPSS